MRVLSGSAINSLTIHDPVSGTDIELHYRTPTTSEHVSYNKGLIKREKNKIVNRAFETRVKWGLRILTGFRAGAFGDEQGNPISSDSKSANYREDWKRLIEVYAPEVVSAFSLAVFEGAQVKLAIEGEDEEYDAGEEGEDKEEAGEAEEAAPLARSSDGS